MSSAESCYLLALPCVFMSQHPHTAGAGANKSHHVSSVQDFTELLLLYIHIIPTVIGNKISWTNLSNLDKDGRKNCSWPASSMQDNWNSFLRLFHHRPSNYRHKMLRTIVLLPVWIHKKLNLCVEIKSLILQQHCNIDEAEALRT